jgi:translin
MGKIDNLHEIGEGARQVLDARTRARENALSQARRLTRHSAHAIRAIHRKESDTAQENLDVARQLTESLRNDLINDYPDLYFAGYSQDAIKEFAEASLTRALVLDEPLPTPEELGVEYAAYLNGLAEAAGELRRHCLDILRQGYSAEAERLLDCMDEIYGLLVTMDYPDAITSGLRRQTDMVRGVTERTRGDLTTSLREQKLQATLEETIAALNAHSQGRHEDD